jgi:hypothetical protein
VSSQGITVGSIIECHLAGYWRVEEVYASALNAQPKVYRIRQVMTSGFKQVKSSKKVTQVGAHEAHLVTEQNVDVTRARIEYGLKKLRELVKGAPQ